MAIDQSMANAWLEAADDLGIRVVAPFRLVTGDGEVWFEAFIPDFGGPKGTIAGSIENPVPNSRQQLGYFPSDLGPSYRGYVRQFFIDTLNDWGWFGEEGKKPRWYTGQPWS